MSQNTANATDATQARNMQILRYVVLGVFFMIGMSYAAVPLYDLFCRVTGYGGTVKVNTDISAISASSAPVGAVTVRFDANTNATLPWDFSGPVPLRNVPLGEMHMITYTAKN
ncbi:MAG: cytochrome c oxidase assembly protein, partial [Pseudomonadota bacterium]